MTRDDLRAAMASVYNRGRCELCLYAYRTFERDGIRVWETGRISCFPEGEGAGWEVRPWFYRHNYRADGTQLPNTYPTTKDFSCTTAEETVAAIERRGWLANVKSLGYWRGQEYAHEGAAA